MKNKLILIGITAVAVSLGILVVEIFTNGDNYADDSYNDEFYVDYNETEDHG